jgi:hypothetical protein
MLRVLSCVVAFVLLLTRSSFLFYSPPVLPGEVNPHDPACKYFKTRMCGR